MWLGNSEEGPHGMISDTKPSRGHNRLKIEHSGDGSNKNGNDTNHINNNDGDNNNNSNRESNALIMVPCLESQAAAS